MKFPLLPRRLLLAFMVATSALQAQLARWSDETLPVKEHVEIRLDATRENEAREAHYMNRLANGVKAELWHDSSGHDRHLTQWTASARPLWNSGAFEFDGDDYLAAILTPGEKLKEGTIFIVASVPGSAGDFPSLVSFARRGENDFTSGLCVDFGRPAAPVGTLHYLNVEGAGQLREANSLSSPLSGKVGHVFSITLDAKESLIRVDGQAQGRRERGDVAPSMERFAVGARFVEPEMRHFLRGRIAEVIVFGRKLEAPEVALMETWLTKKHATFLANAATPSVPDSKAAKPVVQMLVPGFEVKELPVSLTNLNNIEYATDGRLFAAGYDGRFHLLRDLDGDGIEEDAVTFEDKTSDDYPIGMVIKDGIPHAILTDEIVRFRDTNNDGVPDVRETVVKGWDDPTLRSNPLLMHRRVDSAMALAAGPNGDWYVTMGSANPGNGYWQHAEGDPFAADNKKTGKASYTTDKLRGCLLRIDKTGKIERLNSGLRYIMSLQWDRHGELFGTDQEGATWLPNGNPFDELLHLQKGRHYGFPPRHPEYLPDVIDEPSVWDYAPQHQSTCGFRFNGPAQDRARFGPDFWAHDAIVTGEARGKLWRTKLAKTPAGYVASTQLFACLGMLVTDCAISPDGALVICCHSGDPDWGSGPNGPGRIFKIRYKDPTIPQPVLTWATNENTTVIAFDKPLDPAAAKAQVTAEAGRFIDAGHRHETMRPGYAVVKLQQSEKRESLAVTSTELSADRRSITIHNAPRTTAVNYALTVRTSATRIDLAHDLSGVSGGWAGENSAERISFWLPHLDFTAAREFTAGSATHDALWQHITKPGLFTLRGQLDLWKMLTPLTQPGSNLGYTPEPETVSVTFQSNGAIDLYAPGAEIQKLSPTETRLTATSSGEGKWQPFVIKLATPATKLDVSYMTTRDARPRALPLRRILLPFAKPATPLEKPAPAPELAGGDWNAGRALYHGKATCFTCHKIRGEGHQVGPDLDNVIHRDYASVLADITDPSAAINPDAVGYLVTMKDGNLVTGTRVRDTTEELHIAQPGGLIAKLKKANVTKSEPLAASLMPAGLDKTLTPSELRDLMTYLLLEAPAGEPKNR